MVTYGRVYPFIGKIVFWNIAVSGKEKRLRYYLRFVTVQRWRPGVC